MIANELTNQTADLATCDMSLADILGDTGPEYTPTDSEIAVMDELPSKIGNSGADAQTKEFAGKAFSFTYPPTPLNKN